mmetsp:Transcript_4466/g.14128  ORF Transcript_4466/g.14128 Transcript_4466/m.14128 type:complete len:209 (+) Transcript_4466:258-884(+)
MRHAKVVVWVPGPEVDHLALAHSHGPQQVVLLGPVRVGFCLDAVIRGVKLAGDVCGIKNSLINPLPSSRFDFGKGEAHAVRIDQDAKDDGKDNRVVRRVWKEAVIALSAGDARNQERKLAPSAPSTSQRPCMPRVQRFGKKAHGELGQGAEEEDCCLGERVRVQYGVSGDRKSNSAREKQAHEPVQHSFRLPVKGFLRDVVTAEAQAR